MNPKITHETVCQAAKAGDLETLHGLIAQRADFKAAVRSYPYMPPIASSATPEVFELLLPFARQYDVLTTIYEVIVGSVPRPQVLNAIIERAHTLLGSSLEDGHIWLKPNFGRMSALHAAARVGNIESLQQLLLLRPNLERTSWQTTALGHAVQCAHAEAVQLLLVAGADPGPALAQLDAGAQADKIARLLVRAGATTSPAAGRLLSLLPKGEWPAVLAQAAPAHTWPHAQVTAAFQVADFETAQALLAAGAESTAAQIGAVRNTDPSILRLAVPNLAQLAPAAITELVARPEHLNDALRAGLDANARDNAGRTLLTLAGWYLGCAHEEARERLYRSVDLLLAAGADRSGMRGRGSPLRAFLETATVAQTDALRWLLDRGLRDPFTLHHLVRSCTPAAPTFLGVFLARGFSPNTRDRNGRTVLHLLAAADDLQEAPTLLRLLLDAGADATATDNEDRTALHVALRHKHAEVIAELQAQRRQSQSIEFRHDIIQRPPALRVRRPLP